MDINKIQKLNQMAQVLEKHNVVSNKDSAVASAAKIYGSEHNYSCDSAEDPYNTEDNELRKDVRKLTFALQRAMQDIKDLKSTISKLDRELNDLRVNQKPVRQVIQEKKVVNEVLKEPIASVNQSPAPAVVAAKPAVQQPIQAPVAEEPKKITSPVDRNGIAPSDVAIDKFFYFGVK